MCNIDINEVKTRLNPSGTDLISHNVQDSLKPSNVFSSESHHPNWMLQFAAGAISGPVSRTITAPLDRLRLQIQINPHKQTVQEAWHSIMANGGIRGLWRGNGINVCKVAPEMAIRFAMFDKIKSMFSQDGQPLTVWQRFLSGAFGGMAGQLVIYPLEVLKIRMMIRKKGEFNGVIHATQKIWRNEGIASFYRGYVSSAAGIVPYTGIDLTIYETLKNYYIYPNLKENEKPPAWKLLSFACISITCGQYSSYPFYLIKSRQQARSEHASLTTIKHRKGCVLCRMLLYVLKKDGIRGLYRGVLPTLAKVLPSGIINYYVYEQARAVLTPYF